jgi:PTS system nitrogen regulatory IIA component
VTESHDHSPFPVVTIPPGEAADHQSVVDYLLRQLVLPGNIDTATIAGLARRIQQREQLGSTAIGGGIAIPHCQVDGLQSIVGIIGESEVGVPWPGSVDGQPVHRVCLVVMPKGPLTVFLRSMEQVVRQLRNEGT